MLGVVLIYFYRLMSSAANYEKRRSKIGGHVSIHQDSANEFEFITSGITLVLPLQNHDALLLCCTLLQTNNRLFFNYICSNAVGSATPFRQFRAAAAGWEQEVRERES